MKSPWSPRPRWPNSISTPALISSLTPAPRTINALQLAGTKNLNAQKWDYWIWSICLLRMVRGWKPLRVWCRRMRTGFKWFTVMRYISGGMCKGTFFFSFSIVLLKIVLVFVQVCWKVMLRWYSTGLGTMLMKLVESIGSKIPGTQKTMLTCFVANERGVRFYERLGYETYENSPGPRVLRNGTKVVCDYVILCKAISLNWTTTKYRMIKMHANYVSNWLLNHSITIKMNCLPKKALLIRNPKDLSVFRSSLGASAWENRMKV